MSRCLVLVGLLAGCAQLAGIDNTSGDGLDRVSVTFDRISVGATVVEAPQDLTGHMAVYLEPTGDRVTADQPVPERWQADIFEPTPVLFDLPDSLQRLWDYPNTTLLGGFIVLEHPDTIDVDPTSQFTVNVALDVPYTAESFQLFSIGSWVARGLEPPIAGATAVAPPVFMESSMANIRGGNYQKISTADTVVVLRYVGNQLNGMAPIPPFDQTGVDTLTGTLAPVDVGTPLAVTIDPTGAAARLSACRPGLGAAAFSWDVRSVPGAEYNGNGPLLNAAAVAPADTMVQAMYGNPLPFPAVLTFATSASRTFTPAGGLPATLFAGMNQREQDPAAGLALDFPAGLPELIKLGGISLSTDGQSITAPVEPIAVELITDRPEGTLFQVELFELVPNAGATALEFQRRLVSSSAQPTLLLPPEAFTVGSTYTLRASVIAGSFPNIADGDLRTRSLPSTQAFLDSGVFTVTP